MERTARRRLTPMHNIGDVIRSIRRTRSLRQVELAQDAGIARSFLSLIETGSRAPSFDCLSRIADALDIPVAAILWRASKKPSRMPANERKLYDRIDGLVDKLVS